MLFIYSNYYFLDIGEQEVTLNKIIKGIKKESEILEPIIRELLAIILPLVYIADFNLASGSIKPFQDIINEI
jgi:hypothetical protein